MTAVEEMGAYVDGSESEIDENDRPDWDYIIRDFPVTSSYIPTASNDDMSTIGRNFATQFVEKHCANYGAEFWKFPKGRMWDVINRVREGLTAGGWPDEECRRISDTFRRTLDESHGWARSRNALSLQNSEPDPDHVPVVGLDDEYRVWRVIMDGSVDGEGMTPDRYYIPPALAGEVPMNRYHWFGAEVVSPVLPARSEKTYENIRKVCGILRDHLRIHKPMEVSTGLHVHMGHLHGWNLLQLKKFVTLWSLVEDTLIHAHRRDRGSPRMAQW